jgi:hypothetical protein
MAFDKGRHLLLSLDVWKLVANRGDLTVKGEAAERSISLRRSSAVFEGKAKPGDLHPTAFVNCFGSVRESNGKIWRFGNRREDRLERPGHKGRRGR